VYFYYNQGENNMNTNRPALILTVINFILLIAVLAQSRIIATQRIPEVLRVRAFQLVDENGEVRAQFNVDGTSGEVIFRMMDQQGTIRVKLGASENGSGLVLLNDLTEPGVHILAQQGDTSLTITNQSGAKQVIEP
jgi:hypothetical protein